MTDRYPVETLHPDDDDGTMVDNVEILSAAGHKTNAALIADVAALGWLDGHVLDATYGKGNFWKNGAGYLWTGARITTNDLYAEGTKYSYDARDFPEDWGDRYDAVVFDPPYKLNGKAGSVGMDHAYGVGTNATYTERMDLILKGSVECARVARPGGWLHIKVQNQICGGKYVDMARLVKDAVDPTVEAQMIYRQDPVAELRAQWPLVVTPRPQPPGRRQLNPRNNWSVLLSFQVF